MNKVAILFLLSLIAVACIVVSPTAKAVTVRAFEPHETVNDPRIVPIGLPDTRAGIIFLTEDIQLNRLEIKITGVNTEYVKLFLVTEKSYISSESVYGYYGQFWSVPLKSGAVYRHEFMCDGVVVATGYSKTAGTLPIDESIWQTITTNLLPLSLVIIGVIAIVYILRKRRR